MINTACLSYEGIDMSRYCKGRSNNKRHLKESTWPSPFDFSEEVSCWTESLREFIDPEEVIYGVLGMGKFGELFGAAGKPVGEYLVDDPQFAMQYPNLHLVMAAACGDDGKARRGCTLTIVCEAGCAKAGIHDRDHDLSLWVSCSDLGGVFRGLEEALTARPVDWRKVQWKGGNRGR